MRVLAALAAAALGLVACGSSPSSSATGGSGGAGGGGAAPASRCADAAARVTEETTKLGCASDGSFEANCDESFASRPACRDAINAFLQCEIDSPDSDWICDDQGNTNLSPSACPNQQAAIDACSK